ncbi:2-hydroxyglutaryl-CoA dehydratase, partial [Candidatus Aerophobetes bacterium]
MKAYLGIDVGAVSTNLAIIDENRQVLDTLYIQTNGNPIKAVQEGLRKIKKIPVSGVGA